MAYFIYRITEFPLRKLEMVEQHEAYREAKARVKQLREAQAENDPAFIRMIHAESELEAEDLLNQVREPLPQLGDD